MKSILNSVRNLWTSGMDELSETEAVICKPAGKDGWEIHADRYLIHHKSGFRAEFRDAAVYSILNFPYEASIHDIRDWVKQAEHQLVRLGVK